MSPMSIVPLICSVDHDIQILIACNNEGNFTIIMFITMMMMMMIIIIIIHSRPL
jgi:hypothetical protein